MDPASLSNLDPKLRETYERVMGASSPAPTPSAAAPLGASQPQQTNSLSSKPDGMTASDPFSTTKTAAPAITTPAAEALSNPNPQPQIDEQQPSTVTISQPLPQDSAQIMPIAQPHGHSGLIKVFYILGAVVFFVIYVFFWVKIFGFKLPFLS